MSATTYVIIDNNTGSELNLINDTTGGINQNWSDVTAAIPSGTNTSKNPAILHAGIDFERGDLNYKNQGNDTKIDLHVSHRGSTNKVSVDAPGNSVKYRTKIEGGDWSPWGTVVQGEGDLYVEFSIS